MKARRFAPGLAMALALMLLSWGALSSLSAQDYGDSPGTKKSSGTKSSTSTKSRMSSSKEKIYDKLGGMSAIDALTDRFLADIMGTAPTSMSGTTGTMGTMTTTTTTTTTTTGQTGVSGIGRTGVSGSGMGVDTMGNTGLPPHATVSTPTGTATTPGTTPSPGVTGTTGSAGGPMGTGTGQYGTTGTMTDSGHMGTMTQTNTQTTIGTIGHTGYGGSGMGTVRNMGGWDYTALREHVRTELCKASGGPCKVAKLPKSFKKEDQPRITMAEWDQAMNDFRQALSSYNLSSQEQDKLVAALNSTRSDLMRDSNSKSMKIDERDRMHNRHHGGMKGGMMGSDTTGRGGMGR